MQIFGDGNARQNEMKSPTCGESVIKQWNVSPRGELLNENSYFRLQMLTIT